MRRLVPAVLLLAACGPALRPPVADYDQLTSEEIRASDAGDLYELIEHQRPRWLIGRSDRSIRLETVILVYQDGARLGGLDVLRDIPLIGVRSIRVLDSAEAGLLPGLGSQHVERVIYILTHQRQSASAGRSEASYAAGRKGRLQG